MKGIRWIVLVMALIALSGCSDNEGADKENSEEPNLQIIEVKVETDPTTIEVGKDTEIKAIVTQGDELVSDANEVQFEIWKEGAADDDHFKKEASLQDEGEYVINYSFEEKGKYFIIAHTTARDMHNMPKVEIQVQ